MTFAGSLLANRPKDGVKNKSCVNSRVKLDSTFAHCPIETPMVTSSEDAINNNYSHRVKCILLPQSKTQ